MMRIIIILIVHNRPMMTVSRPCCRLSTMMIDDYDYDYDNDW